MTFGPVARLAPGPGGGVLADGGGRWLASADSRRPERVTDVDYLVVGAGIAGAATAQHLRRRGAGSVLIVEQEPMPGVHSTGRNAAIVRDVNVQASIEGLMRRGADCLRGGEFATYEPTGLMLLDVGDEPVGARFPPAQGNGTFIPSCGVVDVAGLLDSYLRGIDVQYSTRLAGWERHADRLRVATSRGEVTCRRLVNAAGPWAGELGGLPLQPLNRTIYMTPPMGEINPHWTCVLHARQGLYFRPESGGLILCPCDERPAAPGDYHEDPELLMELAEKLERLQPGLSEVSIRTGWVGQRTFAPDRNFVIGHDPRDTCVFHVAGLGGHGVTASWAVGEMAARLLVDGPGGPEPYSPARLLA